MRDEFCQWRDIAIERNAETLLEFDRVLIAGAQYAFTESAKERFRTLLPLTSLAAIHAEQELLRQMLFIMGKGDGAPVEGLRDLRNHLEKLGTIGVSLSGQELLDLAIFLDSVGELKKFVSRHRESAPAIHDVFNGFTPIPELAKSIRAAIDDEGNIRPDASSELKKLYQQERAAEERILKEINRQMRFWGAQDVLQDNYYTLRGGRYVLPVRAGAKSRMRGIVHDISGSGETFFIEPLEIVELTNDLATIRLKIQVEIHRILAELTESARSHIETLRLNARLACDFDFLHARAHFADVYQFSIPEMTEGGSLNLLRAHHPLLYMKDKNSSVPLTLRLGKKDNVLVVSGPNAGGKTTALKTIGLLSMMAQAGLAIPAYPDSSLPLFCRWFADIGDAQDVTEGVSTFSAHVRNISRILREANEKSLILLDELGTATDPIEGGALAVGILEKLSRCAALIIATSHLSPLKAWAHEFAGARNASFRLDEKTHQPTFQLMMDIPGASEAFHIAHREGLPRDILKRASELLPKGEADLSHIVESLQRKEKEIGEKKREIATLVEEQKVLRNRINELQEFLKEKEKRLTEEMLEAKEKILSEAREFIEKQIANLPTRKEATTARQAITKELQTVYKEQRKIQEAKFRAIDPSEFKSGQTVYLPQLGECGEIKKIDRGKGTALITVREMEVTTPLYHLRIPEEEAPPRQKTPRISYTRKKDVHLELNLHGMRVDEMLAAVEKHLNDALLADAPYVKLVHGVGTGALRRALHEYLRNHPAVKEYHLGLPEEGGGGVTIVKF